MRLAFALHRTVDELRTSLSSEDYPLYLAYMQTEGLPTERLEVCTALAGTAVCRHLAKSPVKPQDLIPSSRTAPVHELSFADGMALFARTYAGKPSA